MYVYKNKQLKKINRFTEFKFCLQQLIFEHQYIPRDVTKVFLVPRKETVKIRDAENGWCPTNTQKIF